MFCSNCGNEILENAKFCPHCGKSSSMNSDLSVNSVETLAHNTEPPKIEIYRKFAFYGYLNDFKVYIDGDEVGRVGSGKSKVFTVTPGTHKVKVKITWWWDHSREVSFIAENGNISKFQCEFTFGLLGTLIGWACIKSLFTGGNVIKLEQC